MKGFKARWTIALAVVAIAANGGIVADHHEEPGIDMAAMMEAMAQAAAPAEQHEHLKAFEGTWTAQSRVLGGPEPIESRGIMQSEMVLGGRFLYSRYKGELMGRQFLGIGFEGYDKQAGKQIGIWMDTMGTSVAFFEGESSEDGKVRTMYSEIHDPASGKTKSVKGVTSIVSTTRYTYEAWEKNADGEYVKTMEAIFSKQ